MGRGIFSVLSKRIGSCRGDADNTANFTNNLDQNADSNDEQNFDSGGKSGVILTAFLIEFRERKVRLPEMDGLFKSHDLLGLRRDDLLGQSVLPKGLNLGNFLGDSMVSNVAREIQEAQKAMQAVTTLFPCKAAVEALRLSRTENSLGRSCSELLEQLKSYQLPKLFEQGIASQLDLFGGVRVQMREFATATSSLQKAVNDAWQPGFTAIQILHSRIAEKDSMTSQIRALELGAALRERMESLSQLAMWRAAAFDDEGEDRDEFLDETKSLIEESGEAQIIYEAPVSCGELIRSGIGNFLIAAIKKDPEKVFKMSPRDFEKLVAEIFHQNGFEVELTPATRDGGLDMVAVRHNVLLGSETHLVESKRYARHNSVGVEVVRSLLGVLNDRNATKGIIVTTSRFTKGAREFGQRNHNRIALQGYEALLAWINNLKC